MRQAVFPPGEGSAGIREGAGPVPPGPIFSGTRNLLLRMDPPTSRSRSMAAQRRVVELFARLDDAEVVYCHWKSNEHLDAALAGDTDLDLLVDPAGRERAAKILTELDFVRFLAPAWGRYDGIEDHVGFDPDSGGLIHLHWHWELSVGRGGVKEYRLPWERYVLDTRRRDPEHDCFVADPAVEYVLLLVRARLKGKGLDADFVREANWLRERIDAPHLTEVVTQLLGAAAAPAIVSTLAAAPTEGTLVELGYRASPSLASYSRLSSGARIATRVRRTVARQIARVRDRILHHPVARRRIRPQGGIVLAVLGADGSGKSSTTADLAKWLMWKVDVHSLYMGVPKLLTRGMRRIVRVAPRTAPDDEKPAPTDPPRKRSALRPILRALWASSIAFDKRVRRKRVARARRRGLIVVCDRYPQSTTMNFNDGPLLSAWRDHSNALVRKLARWEFASYRPGTQTAPDLVLELIVSPEVSVARRPDEMTLETARAKTESIRSLTFPPATRVVELDADRPLEEVLLRARRAVWEVIAG